MVNKPPKNKLKYNRLIYEQQDRAAMGSPVYVVIANIYMEQFEEQAIANVTCKPKNGAAMGSHVSTVIANIYMEKFEEQADGGNRNVAINIKSDSVMRQMNKVHLLIN